MSNELQYFSTVYFFSFSGYFFFILYGPAQFDAEFMFLVKVGPLTERVEMNRIVCEDESCAVAEKIIVVLKKDDGLHKIMKTNLVYFLEIFLKIDSQIGI